MENNTQKLLPPAKDGRLYYSNDDLLRSRKLLKLLDQLEHASECYRYYSDEIGNIGIALHFHFTGPPKHRFWDSILKKYGL